jgi:hypothetical protein
MVPKMNKEVSIAEELWLVLVRKDRAGAQEVVNNLDLPLVATSTFSFKEIEGEFQDARDWKPLEPCSAQGVLSPKLVSADIPMATIDAWNMMDHVM